MQTTKGFPKEMKFGKKWIGLEHPTYIIADIGANFDGSLEKAKELAHAAKEAGTDVVKFQSFLAPKIVSGKGFASMKLKGVHSTWGKPVEEVFKEAEFPREWHEELAKYCKKIGTVFSSSPYDFAAVDLLDEINVDFYKIGSGEITWHEMLEYIAKKGRPMILSTGASTLAEVDEAVRVIEATGNNQLALLQCITNYPSKPESANLNVLKTYQTAFDIITGYSDHTPGDTVILGSIALGGRIVEKHFTLDKSEAGPDHPHSMDPQEFRSMVDHIRMLESALGTTRKDVVEEEAETVIVQRRGLYVNKKILKGEKIRKTDLIELRPALGILPKYKPLLIGKKAKETIEAGQAIYWDTVL
jgi:pseudaminic acid synthase